MKLIDGTPTAVVDTGSVAMEIPFDYGLLESIEEKMGKTINELAFVDFVGFSPSTPDQAAVMRAMQQVSVKFVVTFTAACLGCDRSLLKTVVAPSNLPAVFSELGATFIEAVRQFNGIRPSAAARTVPDALDPRMPAETNPPATTPQANSSAD